jgi:hypothetical protein
LTLRTATSKVRRSCLDHHLRDELVGRGPVLGEVGGPGVVEVLQRGQQARPDRRVVLGHRAELPVVAAERLQYRHERVQVVDVVDDVAERVEQPVALVGHRHREELARLRVAQEQVRVEVQRCLVAGGRGLGEVGPHGGDVHANASSNVRPARGR